MEGVVAGIDRSFWRGRRVLLTGATGFKGSWLAIWLARMGANVFGLGLEPVEGDLFLSANVADMIDNAIIDIRDQPALAGYVVDANPQIVFHLAAQAIVREGYRDPVGTFATNVMGSIHLLEACRNAAEVEAIVAITTDKVYSNVETVLPYRETDPLGGHDPYSASKAACEIATASYEKAFLTECGIAVATARAGNVIGGGDWSRDRLIPDAVRAWSNDKTLEIRRPNSVRPWQHVLEPLAGYLILAQRITADRRLAGAYNFGPHTHEAASVRDVIEIARTAFGRGAVAYTGEPGPYEAGLLMLETAKARSVLGQAPRWNLERGIEKTMDWYRRFYDGVPAIQLCEQDLADWAAAA